MLPNLDPTKWAGDILNAVLNEIGKALLEAMRGFIDWALGFGDSSLNFVTQTPAADTYESTTVRSLWDFSRAIVNVGLAVILAALLNSREVRARSSELAPLIASIRRRRSTFFRV